MFRYFKRLYQGIKRNYHPDSRKEHRKNPVISFFSSIINYILGRPKPFTLSQEQQEEFEGGLDNRLRLNYDVFYRPGKIVLKRRSLDSLID